MAAAIYAGLWTATLHYRNEARSLQSQRLPLEAQMSNYQEYVKMEEHLAALDKLVKQAVGNNPDWTLLILQMNRNIPANLWLTEVTITSNKEGSNPPAPATKSQGEVTIRGWTFDYSSLAGWLEELRQVPTLTDIKCQYASTESLNSKTIVKFEIKSDIQPPKATGGGQKTQ